MIEKIKDYKAVADNITMLIKMISIERKKAVYRLWQEVPEWSADRANYYLKRSPTSISDEFLNVVMNNFDVTEEEVLKGAI